MRGQSPQGNVSLASKLDTGKDGWEGSSDRNALFVLCFLSFRDI